jgi:hypothetical protein
MKKWVKSFESFRKINEAFLPKDKEAAIKQIISYLESNTKIIFYPYGEIFDIKKGDVALEGELFLSLTSEKAIRFNWVNGDTRSEIHSIDIWKDFEFDINPDYTLELNGNSVVPALKQILEFYLNPEAMIRTSSDKTEFEETKEEILEEPVLAEKKVNESDILQQSLEDAEKRMKRLKNPESRAKQQELIDEIKAKLADPESATTDGIESGTKARNNDPRMDVFRAIELNTIQVARGKSNALIITGLAGIGKTNTVTETLKSVGMHPGNAYYKATGDISTAGLYEILFKYRHRLILFDDCDGVFRDPESLNMLKGALDTYEKRDISNIKKGHAYYDPDDMTDIDMDIKWEQDKKLPTQFVFDGQVIFVSNLPEAKFDKALISRSLHVDVNLDKDEIISRMRDIMMKMLPKVEMYKKAEAFDYLVYVINNYPTKFDLNIRSLIHAINLRSNPENEANESIGGVSEPAWKWLIKQYLVKSR